MTAILDFQIPNMFEELQGLNLCGLIRYYLCYLSCIITEVILLFLLTMSSGFTKYFRINDKIFIILQDKFSKFRKILQI